MYNPHEGPLIHHIFGSLYEAGTYATMRAMKDHRIWRVYKLPDSRYWIAHQRDGHWREND